MNLKQGYYLLRLLGPRVLWLRAGVVLSHRLGTLRRAFLIRDWNEIRLPDILMSGVPTDPAGYARFKGDHFPAFLFPPGCPPTIPESFRGGEEGRLSERVNLLTQDRCIYFFKTPSPGAVQWYVNSLTGGQSNPNRPWYEVPSFAAEQGDVRTMWEPSRAAWAIDLARWGTRGMQPSAAPIFRRWCDSWMEACPPFRGVHWMCGQESSIRFLAMALGFWAFAGDATPEQWLQFTRLAWATGYRVARHINYAISQKNNHAISEALGLLLVSYLFPEFRESGTWRDRGRQVFENELRRQIYEDGSYVQHSMNYHRVMLQGATVGVRLAELAGRPFPRDIYDRLGKAGEFLFQMMDVRTGMLPNYGANDGSNILPLTECDQADYRPTIQATHYLVHRRRLLPAGPWDEALLWLFGSDVLASPQAPARQPVSSGFESGGYYTLRRPETWAMVRCHRYRDRQGQCDTLHVDLWWRGRNVLCDAGSYQYFTPGRPDLERYFKSIRAHNTVEVDGTDPLELVSRFLWLPWSRAEKRQFVPEGPGPIWFEGQTRDYDRSPWHVLHRRTLVSLDEATWVVVDDLIGSGRRGLTLRWHMLDVPYELDVAEARVRLDLDGESFMVQVVGSPAAPGRCGVFRECDKAGHVRGFVSPVYAERRPAPVLEVAGDYSLPQRFLTIVCPRDRVAASCRVASASVESWRISAGSGAWQLDLQAPDRTRDRTVLNCTETEVAPRPTAP